jgi:hypothetical protein
MIQKKKAMTIKKIKPKRYLTNVKNVIGGFIQCKEVAAAFEDRDWSTKVSNEKKQPLNKIGS